MKKVYIIYDTSWLLKGQVLWTFDYLPGWVTRHLIIPEEIKVEVNQHLQNPENENLAKAVHQVIAQFLGDEGHMEMEMCDLPPCPFSAGYPAANSKAGRKLVDLAFHLVNSDKGCFVYVATLDGGIQSELSLLYSQKKLPVFSPATIHQFRKFIGCPNGFFPELYKSQDRDSGMEISRT